MTILEHTPTEYVDTYIHNETFRKRIAESVRAIGSFVINRVTVSDNPISKQTYTPVFYHESYPLLNDTNIVLGEE